MLIASLLYEDNATFPRVSPECQLFTCNANPVGLGALLSLFDRRKVRLQEVSKLLQSPRVLCQNDPL